MREAKSKELKKDLEILSQTFERVVDRKESVVKSLGKDLLEAEEQYSMALRSHLQNVDNLIGRVPSDDVNEYDFSQSFCVLCDHLVGRALVTPLSIGFKSHPVQIFTL